MKKSVQLFSVIGVLISLSVVFELLIAFPILPNASFLLYSPGDLPLLFIGYFFGPFFGILGSAIKSILFILFRPDGNGLWGMVMHFLASSTFVLVFSGIARRKQKGSIWIGLILGTLARAGMMIPANILITPIYLNVPVEVVKKMLLPAIIPFNIFHSGINSILFTLLYPRIKDFFVCFAQKQSS
ncbi:MAG: ECF transporter S component [Caldisericia bacterium]|nr:ECF transporter S component [Caldisericia bacterium]MDD4614043.1 ECF transporter S component [Caldisericia bacterium]